MKCLVQLFAILLFLVHERVTWHVPVFLFGWLKLFKCETNKESVGKDTLQGAQLSK